MLLLTYIRSDSENTNKAHGFSIGAASKSVLFLFGFFEFVGISITYHSLLYGYTMPSWAIPLIVLSMLPFGLRVRVALSEDSTVLYRQLALFGIILKEAVISSSEFTDLEVLPTNSIDKQFYLVLQSKELKESVHYCHINPKRIPALKKRLNLMLGLVRESTTQC